MSGKTVSGKPKEHAVPFAEKGLHFGKGNELARANGCEVRRVCEQHDPAASQRTQYEFTVGCACRKIGGLVAYAKGEKGGVFSEWACHDAVSSLSGS